VHFNFKEYLTMTAPIQEGYPQPLCDQPAARAAAAMADRERDAAALAEQLRFERLLSEISGTLNGLDFDQINRFIPTALGNVSELLGSDLSTFLQTSEDTGEFLHTHQWVAPGVSFDMDFTGVDLAKSVPWLVGEMNKLEPIHIAGLDDFPEAAHREKALAKQLNIQSVLWVPVAVRGKLTACIVLNTLHRQAIWPEHLVRRLSIMGEVFANALSRARSEQVLAEQLKFERLVGELSAQLLAMSTDQQIDSTINDALRKLGEHMRVDRCLIDQFSDDMSEFRVTHMWRAPGIVEDKFVFEAMLSNYVPWYTKRMRNDEPIIFTDPDEMPAEAVNEKKYCRKTGIKSSAIVSLMIGGKAIGNIGFDMIRHERTWPEDTLKRLRLLGRVLGSSLNRRRNDDRLRQAHNEIKTLKERLEAENVYLRKEIERDYSQVGILANSDAMRDVLRQIEQVADTGATVLLTGETGTGKELVASAIHRLSSRGDRPLVKVNCAALPATLVEAELFGREKGAYTGAMNKQIGRFELADGSTLFLDEIGELPPELQVKLLRVLQEGEFERLGSSRVIKVDVRVVAATNRDLDKAIREGRFREDLYYRLNVFPITVPPLRARPGDIPALVWEFVEELGEQMGKKIDAIREPSMELLQRYDWPGNVRELRNVVERALILNRGSTLRIDLPLKQDTAAAPGLTLEDVERRHIESVLSTTHWRISGKGAAAELLGLKSTTLRSRMAKLGIKRAD
jgi:transcriptional regulator with GAF, ATPase, and Fis domain